MEISFRRLVKAFGVEFHWLVEDVGIALKGQVGDDNQIASLQQVAIWKRVVLGHDAMDCRYRWIQPEAFVDDLIQIAHLGNCLVRPLIVVLAESFSH